MWAREKEEEIIPYGAATDAIRAGGDEADVPLNTGRSLVRFAGRGYQVQFKEFIRYVRNKLSRDIEISAPNKAMLSDKAEYWGRYGVALVPAAITELRPFLPELRKFGVLSLAAERYLRATIMESPDPQHAAWALNATRVTQSKYSGAGIRVAVLDSGIATAHPAFASRIEATETFVSGFPVEDGFGHGTHVAGIACGALPAPGAQRFGIAHKATILAARVLADDGLGTDESMIKGIRWAQDKRADIVIMAFGGSVRVGDSHNAELEQVMRAALNSGVLLIAETGNDSSRTAIGAVNAPANCPSVFAAGSVGPGLAGMAPFVPSHFSCGGRNIDGEVNAVAPGENILSAWTGGGTRSLDGTSQATAVVGGIAALLAEATSLRGLDLWRKIEETADKFSPDVLSVGRGLVQAPLN